MRYPLLIYTLALLLILFAARAKADVYIFKMDNIGYTTNAKTYEEAAQKCFNHFKHPNMSEVEGLSIIDMCANPTGEHDSKNKMESK